MIIFGIDVPLAEIMFAQALIAAVILVESIVIVLLLMKNIKSLKGVGVASQVISKPLTQPLIKPVEVPVAKPVEKKSLFAKRPVAQQVKEAVYPSLIIPRYTEQQTGRNSGVISKVFNKKTIRTAAGVEKSVPQQEESRITYDEKRKIWKRIDELREQLMQARNEGGYDSWGINAPVTVDINAIKQEIIELRKKIE